MDIELLKKLSKNPHFKMSKEQEEALREHEAGIVHKVKPVRHSTRVRKTKPKLKKHNPDINKEE